MFLENVINCYNKKDCHIKCLGHTMMQRKLGQMIESHFFLYKSYAHTLDVIVYFYFAFLELELILSSVHDCSLFSANCFTGKSGFASSGAVRIRNRKI